MKRRHLPVRIQSHGSCLPRIAAFLLTALLSSISTVTFATEFSVENNGVTIYYKSFYDKEVEVTEKSNASYSGAVNIPATVTYNGANYKVTSIGYHAFYMKSLTSVTIPNSVTSIGKEAFYDCDKLTSVNIPGSVTSIGESAFKGCDKLTSVNIPGSVTSIGEHAFYWCSKLTTVTLQGTTLPTCGDNAFYDISSGATLYCNTILADKCRNNAPWNKFNTVVNSFAIEITDAGIATGFFDKDLNFSGVTGVKAYIASGFNPQTGKVLMTNVTEVPANTGFIVKGEKGTYEIPSVDTKYMYVNLLAGTLQSTTLPQTTDNHTNYVLGKGNDNKAGFFLATNNCTVPAYKAYLQIPTSAVATTTSNVKTALSIGFDDEDGTITGIAPVKTVEEEMDGNTVIYNINGQRMQSLTKGLNIVNGKKIFIK